MTTYNETTPSSEGNEGNNAVKPIIIGQAIYLSIIAVIGIFANLVVLVKSIRYQRSLICRGRVSMTITNFLVISLAISDLGTLTFSLSFSVFPHLYPDFWITDFSCKYIQPFREWFLAVSIFCVAFIALGRYLIIFETFREKLTFFSSNAINIILLWILSYLIFALPFSAVYKLQHEDGLRSCDSKWDTLAGRRVHVTFVVLVNVLLPTLTVSLSYIGIIRQLRKVRMVVFPEEVSNKMAKQAMMTLTIQSHRIVKVSFFLLVAFYVTYFPYLMLIIAVEYGNVDQSSFPQLELIHAIATCLVYTCAMVNPIILMFTSDLYRPNSKAINKIFVCLMSAL